MRAAPGWPQQGLVDSAPPTCGTPDDVAPAEAQDACTALGELWRRPAGPALPTRSASCDVLLASPVAEAQAVYKALGWSWQVPAGPAGS